MRDMNYMKKRDGRIMPFEISRIENAISKALAAVGVSDQEKVKKISEETYSILKSSQRGYYPEVEETQDIVEKKLFENNEYDAAKAYILYREQHKSLRDVRKSLLDVVDTLDSYVQQSDWRVNENSNSDYSFSGLLLHAAGSVVANYTLNKIYPPEVSYAHRHGDIHIHDLSMGIAGYCAGWSIRNLLTQGFGGVEAKVSAQPPRHLLSALGQIVNFLGTAQNEWAGAQAFSSFDTYLAPYVRFDNLNYQQVKQAIQAFVFNLNVASRWGGQTPFTNLTFDWVVPEDLKDQSVQIGTEFTDFVYGDFQKEMNIINKAFIEVMMEGDSTGRIFTFPIPTYNITRDFDWEDENVDLLFELTAKYGIPYFQNFVNSSLKPSDVRSMCCRLQLDIRELKNKTGGLFGSGEQTGSIGVVTINMPRIGYLSSNEDEFFKRLSSVMNIARDSLEIKRKIVEKNMEKGLFPYTKVYLGTLENHFSTIGLVGMNEAVLNFMGPENDISTPKGKAFAARVLDFMREKLMSFQQQTGSMYNLEATPAEGASYRLPKIDKKMFRNIITSGSENPYYTNSSLLPVDFSQDVFEVLEHQEELQTKYTGGTVLHIFLGESGDSSSIKNLVRKVAYGYTLPYFTISPTFSVCPVDGYIKGKVETCPKCGRETEIYSRVVGYYRPVKNWNKGKKEEFSERITYKVEKDSRQNTDESKRRDNTKMAAVPA
ncbi:ribonucleoside triphosphate reductase [candidate division WOR-3 bacterium]|nr:ribonucleoside triphosphate reductase [candidate division WOR-3 bacterium]